MNTNLNEIPQNWNFYSTQIDEQWASIRLNLGLYDVAPVKTHQRIVWFSIKVQNPDENNFPTQEELKILNEIEDQMYAEVENAGAIFAAVVTSAGAFDFYFYIQDNLAEIQNICDRVMSGFPTYQYEFKHREDAEWEDYLEFLYPNRYAYQAIMNRNVIHQLSENGDNPDAIRPIDHWLYFATEEEQKGFITEVTQQGFALQSSDKLDDKEYPFQVYVIKENTTHLEAINNDVWDLMDLADKFGGYYDGWGCNIVQG